MSLTKRYNGVFGLDRRDSAVEKGGVGTSLYELENYMIHNGTLEARTGLSRIGASTDAALECVSGAVHTGSSGNTLYASSAVFSSDMVGCVATNTTDGSTGLVTAVDSGGTFLTCTLDDGADNTWTVGDAFVVGYPILAIHRFYGLDQNDGTEIKELYCAVADKLKRWNGSTWDNFYMPPGITLTKNVKGTFQQIKDRTYYSNGTDPVLCIKKEDLQVYEAGIIDPDREVVIDDCESTTGWTPGYGASPDTNKSRYYLDAGFDRHTRGDYGITMETSEAVVGATKYFTLTKTLTATKDLEWFFKTLALGTVAATSSGGTKLVATAAVFTVGMVGQQVKNNTDGSKAVIVEYVSTTEVKTSELSGGTDNTWYGTPPTPDTFTVGEPSSEYDYIALDIFRFTKIDIDEVKIEFAEDASFARSYSATVYADSGDYRHTQHQHTLLAQWAMNPRSNTLFMCRFRKSWFVKTGSPTGWSLIKYVRITLRKNFESTGTGTARITIDNIRLLKTPPLPSQMKVQVATCDGDETWTYAHNAMLSPDNDFIRAVEGTACKAIGTGFTGVRTFSGGKDLSQYGEGTDIGAGDQLNFEVCGTGAEVLTDIKITFTFYDHGGNRATCASTIFDNVTLSSGVTGFSQIRKRSIPMQSFTYTDGTFDWSDVHEMRVTNSFGTILYIDDIRIEPATCSKMIESFIDWQMYTMSAASEMVDWYFRNNPSVDRITDLILQWFGNKKYQASGQGMIIPAEFKHGRYKFGDYTLGSLQIIADAGGAMSCTYTDDTDLTEYEESHFNMDAFWHPRENKDSLYGYKFEEIPATPNDQISVWLSTPDTTAIKEIKFKFFCSKSQDWNGVEGTHVGTDDSKVLNTSGLPGNAIDYYWKRIRNTTTGNEQTGIITHISSDKTQIHAWGSTGILTWDDDDTYEIERWTTTAGKHEADPDNYYEYVIDFETMFSNLEGVVKNLNKAIGASGREDRGAFGWKGIKKTIEKYGDTSVDYDTVKEKTAAANADYLELYRQMADEYGVTMVYQETDVDGVNWWQGVVSWKRDEMISHLVNESASMQNIAAIQITVVAKNKKAMVNFQDLKMERKGPINGEVMYKLVLEDEQGFLGPASDASKKLNVDGSTVNLSDLYIPYDTRISRKRLYRSDSTGMFRYLDTIERLATSYRDEIEEELLGETIEADYYKPPRAAIMRKVDNKMAYARVLDRNGRYKPSTVYLSEPFAPHRCSDFNIFDVLPDDGQKITAFEWYYGIYLCWKENSFYTVDPETYRYVPRDKEKGCIAPNSLATIPGVGFGWLSSEGVCIGNHTDYDDMIGLPIWDDLKDYSITTLSKAVGFYHDKHYFLFVGDRLEKCYALYLPFKKWCYISGWTVQCVCKYNAGSDSNEIYAGSNFGYVNRLFNGDADITDDGLKKATEITTAIRFCDYDFDAPEVDKHHQYLVMLIKNLDTHGYTDTADKTTMQVTPYSDQVAGESLPEFEVDSSTYKQKIVNMGEDFPHSLLGVKITGTRRHAIRSLALVAEDHPFRPNV